MISILRPAAPFTGTVPSSGTINRDTITGATLFVLDSAAADGGAEWFQRGEAIEILSFGISASSFLLNYQQAMTTPGGPGAQLKIEAVHTDSGGGTYVVPVTTQLAIMGVNGEIALGEVYVPANLDPYALRVSVVVAWDLSVSASLAGTSYMWLPMVKIKSTRKLLENRP